MSKVSKLQAQELIDEFVGKGKVNILSCSRDEKGEWVVRFKAKGKTEKVVFDDLREAQEFCFEFGGKNNMTVAAPRELLFINPDENHWSTSIFDKYGHTVLSIETKDAKSSKGAKTPIPTILPENCGSAYLPGKKTTKQKEQVELKRTTRYSDEINGKKIYFVYTEQLNNFVKHCKEEFPNHNIPIKAIQTQNNDTGHLCVFERSLVGDGSRRMELRLVEINKKSFSEWKYMDIVAITDGLAVIDCERVKKQGIKEEDLCGISLGV